MPIATEDLFKERLYQDLERPSDVRNAYERDRARIIHSSAFRRLQGKTQVMGVGEGDFHRTRLTHSLEVSQIGTGILAFLKRRHLDDSSISMWLPEPALIDSACYAHDLGHPPYGHGGERALNEAMIGFGGFEGNAQTLRILVKLEKYKKYQGINPTRRTILSVLKYPTPYSGYNEKTYQEKGHPPKCYYDTEQEIIDWTLNKFSPGDLVRLKEKNAKDKPIHKSLDASIMECADDIAYAVHDLEDVVARKLVSKHDLKEHLTGIFPLGRITTQKTDITKEEFIQELFEKGSEDRKQFIGKLVNFFITESFVESLGIFEHPLLDLRARFPDAVEKFLESLKGLTYKLVIQHAEVQQLERRGQRIIRSLFNELITNPEELIPGSAWNSFDATDTKHRRVCDYIGGMTDPYAQKIYHRLFTPGYGSSRDEI